MKAKLIIASPLQLINTIEAKEFLNINEIDITFLSDGNIANEKQITVVLKSLNIPHEIKTINIPKGLSFWKKLLFLKELRKKIDTTNHYEYIIIGHFRSIYQASYANCYKGKKILVDDGTRTIDDMAFLNDSGYHSWSYKLKNIYYSFFSIEPYIILDRYTFFSYYTRKVKVKEHIHLINNDFSFLQKRRIENNTEDNKIAFVGQSLVDSKLITRDYYIELLKRIDSYYKKMYGNDMVIAYYAHRNESDNILELINKKINWKIVKNELPLELHFLLSPNFPLEVGFFFSSVGETLSIIFGNELKLSSFYIETNNFLYRNSEIELLFENNKKSESVQVISDY